MTAEALNFFATMVLLAAALPLGLSGLVRGLRGKKPGRSC